MIQIKGICKTYDHHKVLEKFSCNINKNETTCIMGPSGQGKTTLLRIVMGLEKSDSGEVLGLEYMRKSAVFQEERLCENLTAISNIRLVCQKAIRKEKILEDLLLLGISAYSANQQVRTLSGGQQRRIAILRALMAEYDLLLMDEPFKGLDIETKEHVIHYTKEKTKGKTVIMVTHDEMECDIMGGHVIYMG